MPVVAVYRWYVTIFFTGFCYVTLKKAPGGDLIRVDLIRFPGSIPGDTGRCAPTDIH